MGEVGTEREKVSIQGREFQVCSACQGTGFVSGQSDLLPKDKEDLEEWIKLTVEKEERFLKKMIRKGMRSKISDKEPTCIEMASYYMAFILLVVSCTFLMRHFNVQF